MSQQIYPATQAQSSDLAVDSGVFGDYLKGLGLPTDNIIADSEQRRAVATNLPAFIQSIPAEERAKARYLSKFLGASAIGLFDAALNYIWNEVVINLRKKAVVYGLDLFFDAAVGGKNREYYNTEEDLGGLKDSVLLDTCRKLELISDVVYKKLDHILTMRNDVAASHPNVESIGGFELLGWLQTCVKEVLQDRPSESAIRIKSLVDNIKSLAVVTDAATVQRFSLEVKNLSLPHANNLLITLFGIFVSPGASQILRKNISLIAPAVFNSAAEAVRTRIGIIIDGYRTNLEQDKLERGIEFLGVVDGRRYETLSSKIIAIDSLVDRLDSARQGWDNFYNEPPIMREILSFVGTSSDLPVEVLPKTVCAVLLCRIGRGIPYNRGVSPAGLPLYDKLFTVIDDAGIVQVLIALFNPIVNAKLSNSICQAHLRSVLEICRTSAVSPRLREALDYLIANSGNPIAALQSQEFKDLTSGLLVWL